ncbi:hypothetical protein OJF2_49260 [Aquisphaera giovannonii]|uniref:FG-GAP repeat protein n=1 Tax=Aquisphaera giovannonii TaxID=406548 RepID=A0A5B9W803_9BACT|nr:VCBS repeat-containing protein [Aquisphaera giovannonii]QEH36364.1 hypothetical protein OJF2_49260 [Aquisphaera giovannonii]
MADQGTDESAVVVEPRSEGRPPLRWDPEIARVPLERGWDAEACFVDWDGDGVVELLRTCRGGDAGWSSWLHRPVEAAAPGRPPTYNEGRHLPELDGLRCPCPIPRAGAGLFDLAVVDRGRVAILRNEGGAGSPRFDAEAAIEADPGRALPEGHVVQMAAVDWDGDGRVDVLLGMDDLTDYWPDSGRLPVEQQSGLNQQAGNPCYDLDGLWRGRLPVGRLFWLRNVGDADGLRLEVGAEISGEAGPLDLGFRPAPLAISWGGRSGIEVLVTDHRGLLKIHRNFGGQLPPVLMEPRSLRCGGAPLLMPDDRTTLTAADLDGDGRAGVVYGTSRGRLFAIHAASSRDDATNPAPLLQRPSALILGGFASPIAADLDYDGDLDLVYGDAFGGLHLVEDLGDADDHRYALPVALEAGGAPFRMEPGPDGMMHGPAGRPLGFARPTLADWLGHGRPDLVVSGAGGDVLLLPNDGSPRQPRFGSPMVVRCEGAPLILPPRVRPAVASWGDGDGLDLIAIDLQGFLCRYPVVGAAEVDPPIPLVDHLGRLIRLDGGFGLSGRCSLWAGPWSSPDRVDLLVGLPRENRQIVGGILGRSFADLDEAPTALWIEDLGRDVVSPHALTFRRGGPVVAGYEGCSVQAVPRAGKGLPDLLVCGDDGVVTWIERSELDVDSPREHPKGPPDGRTSPQV